MELFAADGHDAGGCERVTGKSGMRPALKRRAEEYRERLGRPVPECVAAAAVDIYNRHVGKKRCLVKWWKTQASGRLRRGR